MVYVGERTELCFFPATEATGLAKVHPTWAGTFVLAALELRSRQKIGQGVILVTEPHAELKAGFVGRWLVSTYADDCPSMSFLLMHGRHGCRQGSGTVYYTGQTGAQTLPSSSHIALGDARTVPTTRYCSTTLYRCDLLHGLQLVSGPPECYFLPRGNGQGTGIDMH